MKFRIKTILALVAGIVLVLSSLTAANAKPNKVVPAPDSIADQYVVVLKSSDANTKGAQFASKGAKVLHKYHKALNGLAIQASSSVLKKVLNDPDVDYVQQDGKVKASTTQPIPAPPSTYWGLDRIDERSFPLDGVYRYDYTGSTVRAYIIDTGIQFAHSQFGGRATSGADFIDGGLADDCNGHGTHVAGTTGGVTYGVAKSVRLVAVRVLDCGGSGSFSAVIAGVDWVTANSIKPAVANMSLGGGFFAPLNIAVQRSIESGVQYSIAAGNSNADACNASPASTLGAVTVGSTGNHENPADPRSDARSSFSNFGSCLDIFAPGAHIKSAWLANGVNTISGTSMAAPHVAGVIALLLQANPGIGPVEVRNMLVYLASKGKVTNPGAGSPNNLLFNTNILTPLSVE